MNGGRDSVLGQVGPEGEVLDHLARWPMSTQWPRDLCTAVQRKTAVTAYLKNKQLLLFAFARQFCTSLGLGVAIFYSSRCLIAYFHIVDKY